MIEDLKAFAGEIEAERDPLITLEITPLGVAVRARSRFSDLQVSHILHWEGIRDLREGFLLERLRSAARGVKRQLANAA